MSLHNNLAGALDCDHLHDGMGFLTSHVQITRLLEASLQAVDPTVSLPYWEYTIDVEDIVANENGNFQKWSQLEIFSDKFFGATDLSTATIKTGHFKDLSVTPWENVGAVSNSFGLIRAPWNTFSVAAITSHVPTPLHPIATSTPAAQRMQQVCTYTYACTCVCRCTCTCCGCSVHVSSNGHRLLLHTIASSYHRLL